MSALRDDELIVDLFAGGGGASQGIFAATGRHPDIAINHDADAVAVHTRNHPDTTHYCQSIWKVRPEDATQGAPVGLLWASPDCFPAGTLVLTRAGYRPIEQIKIGDEVLTHKLRWRKVVEQHEAVRQLLMIKGHGHPGLVVSPEHPFLARRRRLDEWRAGPNGKRHGPIRCLEPAGWTPAERVGHGTYWASPTEFEALPVPPLQISATEAVEIDETMARLIGHYLAGGEVLAQAERPELSIDCDKRKAEALSEAVSAWDHLGTGLARTGASWSMRERHATIQLYTDSAAMVEWFGRHFGPDHETKTVPGWVLGLSHAWRAAMLDGYVKGGGWTGTIGGNERHQCFIRSKAMAFGIKALAASLGKTVTMQVSARCDLTEPAKKAAKPRWVVTWREDITNSNQQTFREDGLDWAPVRRTTSLDIQRPVFNIGVEEDESYVVEGIVVHNCRHYSRAAGGTPRSKSVRSLPGVVLTWAKRASPRVIVVENVAEMQDWGPLLEDGTQCPDRIGLSFRIWCGRLRGLGYRLEFRKLCAADFGVPTIRTRLFIVARRDGDPIVWPRPTHHKAPSLFEDRWRSAASCIDWSIPVTSIFNRARPLKEATLRRIADGVTRYVIEQADPFIVPTGAGFMIPITHQGPRRGSSLDAPCPTLTCANRGEHAVVTATVAAPHISPFYGTARGASAQDPLGAVTAQGTHHALVTAFLAQHNGGAVGRRAGEPLSTITTIPTQQALVQVTLDETDAAAAERVGAFLIHYYSNGGQGQDIRAPLGTATTKARFALVQVRGVAMPIVDIGMRMLARHELQAAQGFPADYDLTDAGRLPKTAAIRMIGNSVCPGVAEAVVRSLLGPPRSESRRAAA